MLGSEVTTRLPTDLRSPANHAPGECLTDDTSYELQHAPARPCDVSLAKCLQGVHGSGLSAP